MKKWLWRRCLVSAFALFVLINRPMVSLAAEEKSSGPGDRFEQLERRMNELAQRQEQFMQRIAAALQQRPMPGPAAESIGRPMAAPDPEGTAPPMRGPRPAASPNGKIMHRIGEMLRVMFVVGILCNILLAVWIFGDIRKRGEGSGLFVVLALFAGIPAAIIYSLVRLGDRKV